MSETKIKALSEISRDISQVFFAAAFLDPLIKGNFNPAIVIFGFIMALFGWSLSVVLIK